MEEVLLAPLEEMRTYTFTPASRAARAISTFRPCSILYWFSKPPAAARVVPKAEKNIEGGGVREESWEAHREVSASTMVVSLAGGAAEAAGGVRLVIESMREMEGCARRVLRIWEP